MSTPIKFTSAAAIRAHALSRPSDGNGASWFSKDAMKWHATRLQRGTPTRGPDGRWYFIISNDYGPAGRRYAVCAYDTTSNEVEQIGAGELPHASIGAARRAMAALMAGTLNA